jgi:TetR/AcrR family transcriptional regulator, repressor for uid operon
VDGVVTDFLEAHVSDLPLKLLSRREDILVAAQKVFIRKGFDLATVQDVAAACGMSAGNIYRYFPSKAAIIVGLVEHHRTEVAQKFALLAKAPDQVEGFEALGRAYFKNEAVHDAPLTLEIWASACRSPDVQSHCLTMETTIRNQFMEFLARAEAEGKIAPGVDHDMICRLFMGLCQGIIRNMAIHGHDAIDRDLDIMFATLRSAFAGHIRLAPEAGAAS